MQNVVIAWLRIFFMNANRCKLLMVYTSAPKMTLALMCHVVTWLIMLISSVETSGK
jgi:hypothetical protein